MRIRRLAAIAAAVLSLAVPGAAFAQDCPQTTLGDVEDEVMCPVCGVPLELATEAPQANAQRAFIEEQIAQCKSKEEIKDALVAQFGRSVLSLPEDEGFDLAAYLVPILAFLAASAGIAVALARWRRTRPAGTANTADPAAAPPDPEDAERLEADMKKSGI
jgi:cytochrome c-type biogenesis protein CcmH/NrfF